MTIEQHVVGSEFRGKRMPVSSLYRVDVLEHRTARIYHYHPISVLAVDIRDNPPYIPLLFERRSLDSIHESPEWLETPEKKKELEVRHLQPSDLVWIASLYTVEDRYAKRLLSDIRKMDIYAAVGEQQLRRPSPEVFYLLPVLAALPENRSHTNDGAFSRFLAKMPRKE